MKNFGRRRARFFLSFSSFFSSFSSFFSLFSFFFVNTIKPILLVRISSSNDGMLVGRHGSGSFSFFSFSFLVPLLFLFLFSRAPAALFCSVFLVAGCAVLPPLVVDRPAQVLEEMPAGTDDFSVRPDIEGRIAPGGGKVVDRERDAALSYPVAIAMTSVTGEQLVRYLADRFNIEWIAPADSLASVVLTVKMTLATRADIYRLVNRIAESAQMTANWSGNRIEFVAGDRPTPDGRSADWLIVEALAPEMTQLVTSRFDLECSVISGMLTCLGDTLALEAASAFVREWKSIRQDLSYKFVDRRADDIAGVIAAMGLEPYVDAYSVAGRTLVVAPDPAILARLDDALGDILGSCVRWRYRPLRISDETLVDFVSRYPSCADPLVLGDGSILFETAESDRDDILADLSQFDAVSGSHLLRVHLLSAASSAGAQALLDLGTAIQGDYFNAVSGRLVARRDLTLRTFELLVYAGTGRIADQATERLAGSTSTTGTTVTQSVDTRITGVTIAVDGRATNQAFVGQVDLSDSSGGGTTTQSISCSGNIAVRPLENRRLCLIRRAVRSTEAAFIGGDLQNRRSMYSVYLEWLPHYSVNAEAIGRAQELLGS